MSSKIRSLHIVSGVDNRLGGAVHAVLSATSCLVAAGHPAEVLTTYLPGDDISYLQEQFGSVKCNLIPRTFPQRYWNAAEMAPWLDANLERFDIVELHMIWCATTVRGWKAARRANKPFLVRPQSSLDPYDVRKHSLQKKVIGPFFVGPMLRDSAGALLATKLEADRFITYGAQPRKFIVPLVVPERPGGPLDCRQEFRRKYGIPPEAPVVLFLSRIDEKKGLQFLIPAVASLRKTWPDLRLLLVGSGEAGYTARTQAMLREHGLMDATTQTGFLTGGAKHEALAASDIFALPSLNENFGMVVVEAMRAGLPLVVSHEVYTCNEVERAGAGIICAPETKSCESALRRLLEAGPLERRQMGERGRVGANTYFSSEAATTRLLEIYSEVLGRPS